MASKHILVVEDEQDIRELLEYNLSREGFTVSCAGCGEDGLELAQAKRPDLVVLDLMLPGIDGLEVCRRLRKDPDSENIPIVMLTAKGEESDIVAGLEVGADDYVTKPFSAKVLISRIRAVLRRNRREPHDEKDRIQIHDLVIDVRRHEVRVGKELVRLTYTEFSLLRFLASRPGWVFTRYQIVDGIRGEDYAVTDRSVDVQVVGLRRKLGGAGEYIETVRGVGYRFKD
ncbi:MAG: response regulator [Candidatus Eisenbacteria sp.]|nr:response regulator [Candidatus Eisenbacteria bacterium]